MCFLYAISDQSYYRVFFLDNWVIVTRKMRNFCGNNFKLDSSLFCRLPFSVFSEPQAAPVRGEALICDYWINSTSVGVPYVPPLLNWVYVSDFLQNSSEGELRLTTQGCVRRLTLIWVIIVNRVSDELRVEKFFVFFFFLFLSKS